MTNEKKAYQIVKDFQSQDRDWDKFDVEDAAIETAEWKDKCFQAVIDGIKESYHLDNSVIFICDLIEQRYKDKFK